MGLYLDTDALSGAVETVEVDEGTGDFAIRNVCDVQPVIDRNKELLSFGEGCRSYQPGDLDMRLAASIPVTVVLKWINDHGIYAWKREHWPAVKKLLNSNEWRYLRTSEIYL